MSKWQRVGEVPEKIPVNFIIDSVKYPELASWYLTVPRGQMGRFVREALMDYIKRRATGGSQTGGPATQSQPAPPIAMHAEAGGAAPPAAPARAAPTIAESAGVGVVEVQPASDPGGSQESPSLPMDAGTARVLIGLDEGF